MNKLYTFHDYLTGRFGIPLQRLSFDLGLSCPNRRPDGSGGCAFCAAQGARARHLSPDMSLELQAERGKKYLWDRYQFQGPYIAYFQAFTNTFAPFPRLKELYGKALSLADFRMVILSTRPDCLPDDVLDYIAELNRKYEVWIELGVQTANDNTLLKINRGHDFSAVEDTVRRITGRKIRCACHVILGLPGETEDDFLNTADRIAALPFSAVKVHNLLVMRGTPMAGMLHRGEVKPMNEFEYADALSGFLRRLPENWIVMRLSAEDDPEKIIAPKWWMNKSQFLQMFRRNFGSGSSSSAIFQAVKTNDGSYTFYHPEYRQYFHSTAGANRESVVKYLEPCRILQRLQNGENLRILEVGFGLGCNVSALADAVQTAQKGSMEVTSLELDPGVLKAAWELPEHPHKDILKDLLDHKEYRKEKFTCRIVFSDARKFISGLPDAEKYHCIFLDGFSPDHNPELWTIDFIAFLRKHLAENGMIATYCRAYPLLNALAENGFQLWETTAFGRRHGGTLAVRDPVSPPLSVVPLSEKDHHIAMDSSAGIPYRDPGLNGTREEISANRKKEVAQRRAEGMPKWYREENREK